MIPACLLAQIDFSEEKWKKVKLSVFDAMKTNEGVKVKLHAFLTSTLDEGEWSASRLGPFNPRERAPGTHWIGNCTGPRAGLDVVVNRKYLCPCREFNSSRPASSQ
jgi:hypothetical protein